MASAFQDLIAWATSSLKGFQQRIATKLLASIPRVANTLSKASACALVSSRMGERPPIFR
jgi:hypothetical protein